MASASAPHASAQPSAAIASAIISSGRDGSGASAAASAVQPSGARRSRASMMAMSTSSRCTPTRLGIDYGRQRWPLLRPCACARLRVHMQLKQSAWRLVRETLTSQALAFGGALRLRTGAVPLCGSGSAGLGGGAPVRAQRRRTPAQPTAHRPLPRDAARTAQAAPSTGWFAKACRNQTNGETNRRPNNQTSKADERRGRNRTDLSHRGTPSTHRGTLSTHRCSGGPKKTKKIGRVYAPSALAANALD